MGLWQSRRARVHLSMHNQNYNVAEIIKSFTGQVIVVKVGDECI
jgi:hypothetical protein